jgi:signal transduction histidine kinase/ActR/RegA family two-component response regulator
MKNWFARLPIHRKLVALALTVTTVAVCAAIVGLTIFDIARFRTTTMEGVRALATLVAEDSSGVLMANDDLAAMQSLKSVGNLPTIELACLYREDGSLFASVERQGYRCPAVPRNLLTWHGVDAAVPVVRNGTHIGTMLIERTLSDLTSRAIATLLMGGVILILSAALALGLAHRLQRIVSQPIVDLAEAAANIGQIERYQIPAIDAPPDETGKLVRAFEGMVERLLQSNEALRAEVDERRRMQAERETLLVREREASRLKDEFLAAVSHELRTPLNAILGWTHILEKTETQDETVRKAVGALSRSAHAQNRVIQDLLDVSRIITGKLELAPAPLDLRRVIESVIESIRPIADAKGVRLDVRLPDAPCPVYGDYDRLRQVVQNLLSNAVKFTPAQGVVIARITEEGVAFSLTVSDTGIGISSRFLPHVFERFRQADASTTRGYGGLGLGLAIVKELIEQHGGRVSASSPGPGFGSMFTITLPRFAGVTAELPRQREVADTVPALHGITVLAIDDNADALEIVTRILHGVGAIVQTASSGAEALSYLREREADVVLCDLAMPEMDGFEVLHLIRQLESSAERLTPVFAVSAFASADDRIRCLAAGFSGHVAKPWSASELIRIVAGAVVSA